MYGNLKDSFQIKHEERNYNIMESESVAGPLDEALENGFLYYTQEPVYKNVYEKVSVHNFSDPSLFHVKVDEKWNAMSLSVDDEIDEFIRNFEFSKKVKTFRIGMPVMAPSQTNPVTYARAQIADVEGEDVLVHLIDDGSIVSVEKDSLRMIPKALLRIPKFLYLCRLHNIVPLNGNKWPEVNWAKFLNDSSDIAVSFVSQDDHGVYSVQMEIDGKSLGVTLILDAGVAKSIDLRTITSTGPYPVYDYSAWENAKVPVYGVSVISTQVAWFQLQTDTANEIIEATAKYISTVTEAQKIEKFPKNVGDPCLALFTDDNSWYRGEITEVRAPGSYKVLFVDFGNVELVTDAQIIKIPQYLVNVPVAATEVSIVDVLGIQGTAELAKLKELVESKDLVASIEDPHMKIGDKERILIAVWQEDGTSLSTHFPRPKTSIEGEPIGYGIANETFSNVMAGGSSEFYPGMEYMGTVSYAESVRSVWLQLHDCEERAINMSPALQKFYSNAELQLPMPAELIRPGVYCVAKQTSDSEWYRALIKDVTPEFVNVIYIDYGNDEDVPISSLKPLISYFARERSLAIQVALDVAMKPDADIAAAEDAVCNAILDFAEGRKLYVTLTNVNTINYASIKVDLCDILFTSGLVYKTHFTNPYNEAYGGLAPETEANLRD